jgi:YVTN family beta-propeller protein
VAQLPSGTVTFLFTDIEGSTLLVRTLRDGYTAVLAEHERLLRDAFHEHSGQVIDTQGDAFFVAFPRAMQAVEAAVAAQRALAAQKWPEGGEVRVRMGLHTGEPVVGDGRYTGLGVHRAARICAAGHGGQILLSSATRELVEDELPDGTELHDLGVQQLKDLPRPERVFQLAAAGLAQDFPPLRSADVEAFAGREGQLAEEARAALAPAWYRRRGLLAGALAGVIAAAVAIPIFALAGGSGGGGSSSVSAEGVAQLDPESGDVVREVEVPGNPGAVAVGEGAVWVTDPGANTVSKINLDSNNVDDEIPVGGGPTAITVGGGAVWVANALDGTVSRIDPSGDERRIPVGNGPVGITYGNDAVWVVNAADRTVSKIDPDTATVVEEPLRTGAAGPGIAVGADAVWVTDQATSTVARVDFASGARRTVPVGGGPTGIAFGDGALWVTNRLDGTVSKIDPASNSVRTTTSVGGGPTDVTVASGAVWVADEFGRTVVRLGTVAGEPVGTVQTGSRPTGLAASADGVWLSVAPAGEAHRGGTLRVQASGLDFIDPALAYSPGSWLNASMISDGLVAFQRSGGSDGTQLVPDLAVSLPAPTDGGRTYTFQLRPDIRYSDGALVRASDFRHAIERVFALESDGVNFFGGILGADACADSGRRCDLSRGIVADDAAGTVTFRLVAPDADFFYKLALPFAYAVPKTVGRREAKTGVPATGPYMVESYRPQRSLKLVRNPRFRPWSHAAQPGGFADEIEWTFVQEGDPEADAVVNGSADISMDNPSPGALPRLRLKYPGQVHVNLQRGTMAFVFDTRKRPFDRLGVRRAVNFAVDRGVATRIGGAGAARPTCQINPANFPGYRRYCPYRVDLDRARKLVVGSGARGAKVTVSTTPIPGWVELGRYGVSVLRRIGLRASLRRVANPERYFGLLYGPGAQMSVLGWVADFASLSQFIQPNFSCGAESNTSHFCDRSVEAGIRGGLRLQVSNPLAANDAWARVDREIVDAAPWAPLFNSAEVHLVSERVGNYQYNPQWGVLLDQLWVK